MCIIFNTLRLFPINTKILTIKIKFRGANTPKSTCFAGAQFEMNEQELSDFFIFYVISFSLIWHTFH